MIADRRRSADVAAQRSLAYVTPDHFAGIDRNPFAVEVAKVTMMLAKKLAADELDDNQQVLPLDNLDNVIIAADALFTPWPKADAIIGNPPYLGRRKMVDELGAAYNDRLQQRYPEVGGVSDYVCYWFPLAHDRLAEGGRAGLVATKTIRETSSRKASLDYVTDHGGIITEAVSSQPWSGDAVVHVSIVNWLKNGDPGQQRVLWLNNTDLRLEVDHIPASLQPGIDVRRAAALPANQHPKVCFQGQTPGVTKGFTLDATEREALIHRDPGAARYIHPFLGGEELLHDLTIDRWVIDLPHLDALAAERDAPALMKHLRREVLPAREKAAGKEAEQNAERRAADPKTKNRRHHSSFLDYWWMHSYRRADMLEAFGRDRYIATSRVASEKRTTVFTFVDASVRPGDSLTTFALDDNYSFGILSSGLHRLWLEARCSRLKADLRYTSTTVFDSFPWPQASTITQVNIIEKIVGELLQVRGEPRRRDVAGPSIRHPPTARQEPAANPARRPRRRRPERLRLLARRRPARAAPRAQP